MKEEQVLLLKRQLEKQIVKWKELKVSDGYLKNLKDCITYLEEIINTGDYNSEKSIALTFAIKTILSIEKLRYQAMSLNSPFVDDSDILPI